MNLPSVAGKIMRFRYESEIRFVCFLRGVAEWMTEMLADSVAAVADIVVHRTFNAKWVEHFTFTSKKKCHQMDSLGLFTRVPYFIQCAMIVRVDLWCCLQHLLFSVERVANRFLTISRMRMVFHQHTSAHHLRKSFRSINLIQRTSLSRIFFGWWFVTSNCVSCRFSNDNFLFSVSRKNKNFALFNSTQSIFVHEWNVVWCILSIKIYMKKN